jgi:hypothetical protein
VVPHDLVQQIQYLGEIGQNSGPVGDHEREVSRWIQNCST